MEFLAGELHVTGLSPHEPAQNVINSSGELRQVLFPAQHSSKRALSPGLKY